MNLTVSLPVIPLPETVFDFVFSPLPDNVTVPRSGSGSSTVSVAVPFFLFFFNLPRVKAFDGTYGYPAAAPYDRILVTAGTESVPEPLLAQLAVWGRLVVPIGPPGRQRLRVIRRRKTDYSQEEGENVTFVPLLGRFAGSPA